MLIPLLCLWWYMQIAPRQKRRSLLLVISSHHYVNKEMTCLSVCVSVCVSLWLSITGAAWPSSEYQSAPLPHLYFSAARVFCNNLNLWTCSGTTLPPRSTIIFSHIPLQVREWKGSWLREMLYVSCPQQPSSVLLEYFYFHWNAVQLVPFSVLVTAKKKPFSESLFSEMDPGWVGSTWAN